MRWIFALLMMVALGCTGMADTLPGFDGAELGKVTCAWKMQDARDATIWCVIAVAEKACLGEPLPPIGEQEVANLKRLDIMANGMSYWAQSLVNQNTECRWTLRVIDTDDKGKTKTTEVPLQLAPLDGYASVPDGVMKVLDGNGELVKQLTTPGASTALLLKPNTYTISYQQYLTVSAVSADPAMGSVAVSDDGKCVRGGQVTLTATPKAGFKFVRWLNAAGASVSTASECVITVNANETFTAVFEAATIDAAVAIALQPGWNLIGVPFVKVTDAGTLFNNVVLDPADGNVRVTTAGELVSGRAYWVYLDGGSVAVTIKGTGYASAESRFVELTGKWNFAAPLGKFGAGSPSFCDVPAGSYGWDAARQRYLQFNTATPAAAGVGYVVQGE